MYTCVHDDRKAAAVGGSKDDDEKVEVKEEHWAEALDRVLWDDELKD